MIRFYTQDIRTKKERQYRSAETLTYSFSPVPSPKTHPKVMTVWQNTHISSNDNNRTNKVYHPVEVVVSSLQVNCFT